MNQKQINQNWKEFELDNGVKQVICIKPSQKMIASCNGKNISVNNNFLKLERDEQKAVVYHERGHLKKMSNILSNISNLFYLLLGLSLAIFIIKISLSITSPGFFNPLKELVFYFSIKDILYLFLIGFIGTLLLKWTVELYCDFNAIKKSGKGFYIDVLRKCFATNKIKQNLFSKVIYWIPNKIDRIVLHPPMFIRTRLIGELD
jgi:Zn-dependent protease with chaperone function